MKTQTLDAFVRRKVQRFNRRCLLADIKSSDHSHLAATVTAMPAALVVAWAELVDGHDDDAMMMWSMLLCDPYADGFKSAEDLVQGFVALATGTTRLYDVGAS